MKKSILKINFLVLIGIIIGLIVYIVWPIINNKYFLDIGKVKVYGKKRKNFTNIALFGLDARDNQLDKESRPDSMLILNINNKNNKAKIVSVYRDLLLKQGNKYDKACHSYVKKGPLGSINMLNENFDLNITKFITVNFKGLVKAIDAIGGIDLKISDVERRLINGYVKETAKVCHMKSTPILYRKNSGIYHVNGLQATSFCRIRYTAGGDFKRTERQRIVLITMLKKAKEMGPIKIHKAIKKVLPYVLTNLTIKDIFKRAKNICKFKIVATDGFPYNKTNGAYKKLSIVVPIQLSKDVKKLHKFLYNDDEYVVPKKIYIIEKNIKYLSYYKHKI